MSALAGLPGRRAEHRTVDGLPHRVTPVPQNALDAAIDDLEPDVVIGNSLVRLSWRRVHATCRRRGVPAVLYVREVASLEHFVDGAPDLVVANAQSLCEAVRAIGIECAFLPSVIDTSPTRTTSTRRTALVVNPIPSHGVELAWTLAERLPEIPFVLQESWPLEEADVGALVARAAEHPNVEIRRSKPAGPDLFADARVLLVPHQIDNRPRVIAEAQANGIPVLGTQFSGLAEAIGPGGSTIDGADLEKWCAEIRRLWSDADHYDTLTERASAHSTRPEIDPGRVAQAFVEVLRRKIPTLG